MAVKVSKPYYKGRYESCRRHRIVYEVWAYQQMQKMLGVCKKLAPWLIAFARLPHDIFILV